MKLLLILVIITSLASCVLVNPNPSGGYHKVSVSRSYSNSRGSGFRVRSRYVPSGRKRTPEEIARNKQRWDETIHNQCTDPVGWTLFNRICKKRGYPKPQEFMDQYASEVKDFQKNFGNAWKKVLTMVVGKKRAKEDYRIDDYPDGGFRKQVAYEEDVDRRYEEWLERN